MTSSSLDRVDKAEAVANDLIRGIQSCVNLIRQAFPTKLSLQETPIAFSILDDRLLGDLASQVEASCRIAGDNLRIEDPWTGRTVTCDIGRTAADKELDQRQILIHQIIFPLLHALRTCYVVLDDVSNPTPVSTPSSQGSVKSKPIPPRGLLSLQAYTDIAALLEFLTCTCIIPWLDANILYTAEQRARLLPKAIGGRLPRASLLWGTQYAVNHDSLSPKRRFQELEWTVAIMGKLILLDRFRPMLLPRHLADLHAALFQIQDENMKPTSASLSEVRARILPSSDCVVDSLLLARSYQTLLLRGTLAPAWLRSSVSQLLSQLARSDLGALIQVFVAAAPKEHASGASLRLSQAILGSRLTGRGSPGNDGHARAVCRQAVELLDRMTNLSDAIRSESMPSVPVLHTIWALIDSIPSSVLQYELFGDFSTTLGARIPRRLEALLSSVPPFANMEKMIRILFQILPTADVNMFDLLLQQACTVSVLHSPEKAVATNVLQALIVHVVACKFTLDKNRASVPGDEILALACIHALASRIEDDTSEAGESLEVSENGDSTSPNTEGNGVRDLVQKLDQRTKAMIHNVLGRMLDGTDVNEAPQQAANSLISSWFVVLLDLYFGNPSNDPNGLIFHDCMPSTIQYTPLVMLPILCEECSATSILYSRGSTRILELMAVAFDSASARLRQGLKSRQSLAPGRRRSNAWEVLSSMVKSTHGTGKPSNGIAFSADDDMIFSMCSLLLSLLVGILELGSDRRSSEDEAILQTFPQHLLPLAERAECDAEHLTNAPEELVGMASHACALIVARLAPTGIDNHNHEDPELDKAGRFEMIENALNSPEAPIRARGVVELRHLVGSIDELPQNDGATLISPALRTASCETDRLKALSLLLKALHDSESYVYLAAIQAIAALTDTRPSELLPILARGVSTGEFGAMTGDAPRTLSSEQRVKLGESLISAIRRKASVHEWLPILFDIMLFSGSAEAYEVSRDTSSEMQMATHDYFQRGSGSARDLLEDDTPVADRWEEMDLRTLTGGPLFGVEESEVVHAAKLSVVVELVIAADPGVLARYCTILVACSLNTLRLGVSRPIRRGGALLARELFAAIVRELNEQGPLSQRNVQIPFTVSMVAAHEEWLAAALKRCLQEDDLSDLGEGKHRLIDPATAARCKEALDFRAEAEQCGILAAGRLVHESQTAGASQSLLSFLREPSQENEHARTATICLIIEEL